MSSDLQAQVEQLAQSCGGTVSVCMRNIKNAFDLAYKEDARLRSASTIKVPILIEALRQVRDGELSLDKQFKITPDLLCDGSGILMHMHEGMVITLYDLLTLMIIVSDNTATNMAIDIVGMDKVNTRMRAFGYTGTYVGRKMYDWADVDKGRDNFIVAKEAADMMVRVVKGEALGGEWDELVLKIMRGQQSSKLGMFFPEEGLVASKSGGLDNVVNDFGVVTTKDFCYSIAVFAQDAPVLGEAGIVIGRISKAIFDAVSAGKSC